MPVVHRKKVRVLIHVYAEFSKIAYVCQKSSKTNRRPVHDQCAYQTVNSLICKYVLRPLANASCSGRTHFYVKEVMVGVLWVPATT